MKYVILHISVTARLTWQISSALPMLAKQSAFYYEVYKSIINLVLL